MQESPFGDWEHIREQNCLVVVLEVHAQFLNSRARVQSEGMQYQSRRAWKCGRMKGSLRQQIACEHNNLCSQEKWWNSRARRGFLLMRNWRWKNTASDVVRWPFLTSMWKCSRTKWSLGQKICHERKSWRCEENWWNSWSRRGFFLMRNWRWQSIVSGVVRCPFVMSNVTSKCKRTKRFVPEGAWNRAISLHETVRPGEGFCANLKKLYKRGQVETNCWSWREVQNGDRVRARARSQLKNKS